MSFFILLLGLYIDFSIDVEDLDLYHPERATVYQWNDHYIFLEYNPAKILKISPKGNVISSFSEEGDGPKEIMKPVPLGFDKTNFFVLSHGSRILVFDKELKPIEMPLPSLRSVLGARIVWQGQKLADGSFVLLFGSTGIHHSHGLIRVKPNGDQWKVLDRYFPYDIAANSKNLPMPNAKNPKWQFAGNSMIKLPSTVLQSEEFYEISFYPKPWESSDFNYPSAVIISDVQGIVSRHKHFRCFPSTVGYWEKGYIVQFGFNRGNQGHDYFDKDGAFIRRDFEDYHIIPVVNTNKTMKLISLENIEIIQMIK